MEIHVLMALTDPGHCYAKFAGTAMFSLFANTRQQVTVHLLHDATLADADRVRFEQVAGTFSQRIRFYDVEALQGERLRRLCQRFPSLVESKFSVAMMYRLLAGDVLPPELERVIYLDADVIVQMDLAELWEQDEGEALAAVPDRVVQQEGHPLVSQGVFSRERYFNSGVLLMHLDAFRSRPLLEEAMQFLHLTEPVLYPDQDFLNAAFQNVYRELPERFNATVKLEFLHGERADAPKIYHYAGNFLTFRAGRDRFSELFYHYFSYTPWCSGYFLASLASRIQQAERERSAQLMQRVLRRGRAFLCRKEDIPAIRTDFDVQPDEPWFFLQDGHLDLSLDRLQHRVLFVCTDYGTMRGLLGSAGMQEHEDFVDAGAYLSEKETGELEAAHTIWCAKEDFRVFRRTRSDEEVLP